MPGIDDEDESSVAKYHVWIQHPCAVLHRHRQTSCRPDAGRSGALHSPLPVRREPGLPQSRDAETARPRVVRAKWQKRARNLVVDPRVNWTPMGSLTVEYT